MVDVSRRGRPRIGERIAFRLPEALRDESDARARSAGISRAEALRVIVEDALSGGDDGVDLAQIDARLALTPARRVETMARDARALAAIRGRATS